jgi:hypothetical protein
LAFKIRQSYSGASQVADTVGTTIGQEIAENLVRKDAEAQSPQGRNTTLGLGSAKILAVVMA